MKAHPTPLIVLALAAALLSGCEQPAGLEKSPAAAKVGGDTITETELNVAVTQFGNLNETQKTEARSKLLQLLIDQRLVVEAARKSGLDKEPGVAVAMAQASRQVLAEAYAEQLAKDAAKPTDSEIAAYYEQHPELFSQRRIYRIQELELRVDPAQLPEVEARLRDSHSMGDFVNWVKAQGIEGKTAVAVRPAEQISAPLLAQLSQMRDGQVTAQPSRPGYVVIQQLVESQLQPVTLEQARQVVERALATQKRKELMEAEVKKLRAAAKIEYASGYAPAAEPAAEAPAADKPAEDKPAN
ncbi:MAG: EpsD family peptidyl-prolyl cis-trans isomerase [Gammaproteobacteria bacterium]